MKTRTLSVAVPILFFSLLQRAPASELDPAAPSPAELDDPVLPVVSELDSPGRTSVLRLQPQVFEAQQKSDAAAGFVGTVRINPALLARPADPIVNIDGSILGIGLPRDTARLQLNVAGEQYELFFFDEQRDPRYGLRHVSMNVLNHADSYARFSVDDRQGLIYGAIYTPTRTLEISPAAKPGQQDVHIFERERLGARSADPGELANPSTLLIAWRHHQLESVAKIRAEHAEAKYEFRSSYLRGGDLGRLRRVDAVEFVRSAASLAAITQFKGDEIFRISEAEPTNDGGQRTRLQQLIGGVPVNAHNEVVTDASGNIISLSTLLAPSDFTPSKPLVSRANAWSRVIASWEALEASKFGTEGSIPEGKLQYRPNGSINNLELIYEFRFVRGAPQLEYLARVNAVTGKTELVRLLSYNFDYLTCNDFYSRDFPTPTPTSCPAPGTFPLIPISLYSIPAAESYPCPQPPATPTSNCAASDSRNVVEVLNGMRVALPAAAATNPGGIGACCQMKVEVIQDMRFRTDASTNSLGTIFLPSNQGDSAEIVAHEVTHVYHYKYNDVLGVSTQLFAGAVMEGIGYAIPAFYASLSGNPSKYGDPWTFGDGPGYVGGVMSANSPNFRYWQDIKSGPGVTVHTAGQVIYRFFRLVKQISGASDQRMLGIALGTLDGIADVDGNGFDAGDFRRAVLASIHPNETTLRNAVNGAYAELYNAIATGPIGAPLPPGEPGPIGSPSAPPSYTGSFSFCSTSQGVAVSVYQTFWPAVSGATQYGLYAKGYRDPAYNYTGVATATTSYIFTNISGDGRVNACNANGCSGLSADAVTVSHQPQCGG